MGVINMSRQFFNTLVGMGSRSHDFDDELKISFLISSSDARSVWGKLLQSHQIWPRCRQNPT